MRDYINAVNILNESEDDQFWVLESVEELEEGRGKLYNLVTGGAAAAALSMGAGMASKAVAAPLPQEVAACSSQNLSWCDITQTKTLAGNQDAAMQKAAAEAAAKMQYTFGDQSRSKDEWKSFDKESAEGQQWQGDCDDLTLTTIEAAVRMGVSETRLYRALVAVQKTEGRQTKTVMGHMVGVYEDTNGKFWVIGDTDGKKLMTSLDSYQGIKYVSPVALGKEWFPVRQLGNFPRLNTIRQAESGNIQSAD